MLEHRQIIRQKLRGVDHTFGLDWGTLSGPKQKETSFRNIHHQEIELWFQGKKFQK